MELTPGQQDEQDLRNMGYSEEDIGHYRTQTVNDLQALNYSDEDIRRYQGIKDPDMSAVKSFFQDNLKEYNETLSKIPVDPKAKNQVQPSDYKEAFLAGLQLSIPGIVKTKNQPQDDLTEDADWSMRLAKSLGTVAGDLPYYGIGAEGGAPMGAALGAKLGSVGGAYGAALGGGLGALAGGGGGAMAFTSGLRKIIMDHYEKGDIQDGADFMQRASAAAWESIKDGTVGAVTGLTGPLAKAVGGPIVGLSAEVATMTTLGKAFQGHIPSAQDFLDSAALIAGLHGVGALAPKLRNIWAKTGESPQSVVDAAGKDPVLKQELLSVNSELPAQAAPEPGGHLVNPNFDQEVQQAKNQKVPEEPSADDVKQDIRLSENGKAFLDLVGEQQQAQPKGIKDRVLDWYGKNFDSSQILRDELNRAGVEPSKEDSSTLLSLMSAVGDKARLFLTAETRDFTTGKANGEGWGKVETDYKKEFPTDPNMDGLKIYGIAARTLELAQRGIEVQVEGKTLDPEVAKETVDEYKDKYQKYLDRKVEYGNRVLKYAHDSGYWTPEQYQAMIDLNKSHFSFHRVQELDPLTGKPGGSVNGVKRIMGEGGELLDPISSMVKDTVMLTRMAEENRVRAQFVKDIFKSENLENFIREEKPQMKPIRISAEEINRALDKQGLPVDGEAEALTVFRPREQFRKDNQFEVHEDGERKVYSVSPLVAEDLNAIAGQPQIASAWVKVLNTVAGALSTATVSDPFFAVRHIYRNIRSSPVYSQTGLRPLLDALIHAPAFFARGTSYNDFVYNGGAVSQLTQLENDFAQKKLEALDTKYPIFNKVWNFAKDAATISHWSIVTADNMTRFAEYQRSVEQGKSPVEAAYNARNVIPDYQKAGLQRSALWSSAAFLRVHVNSEAAMFAHLSQDPQGTVSRALLWHTVPSLLNWAAQQGDDRIKDSLPWMQNTYEQFGIDSWRPAKSLQEAASVPFGSLRRQKQDGSWAINDGPVARLPRAFTLGMFFERAPIVALEAWRNKDPQGVKDFVKSLASSVVAEPVPTALLAPIENTINYNLHTGRAVVSYLNEQKLPMFQYKPYSTELAKQVGKLVGTYAPSALAESGAASPEQIDNLLRGWTGRQGMYAVGLIDKALHAAGAGSTSSTPTKSFYELPYVEEFFSVNRAGSSKTVQTFYDNLRETEGFKKSIQALRKEQKPEEIAKLMQLYPERRMDLSHFGQALTQISAQIYKISSAPDKAFSPDDKQQLINSLMGKTVIAARAANERYDAFKKAVADAKSRGHNQNQLRGN